VLSFGCDRDSFHDGVNRLAHGPSACRRSVGITLNRSAYRQHDIGAQVLDDAHRRRGTDTADDDGQRRFDVNWVSSANACTIPKPTLIALVITMPAPNSCARCAFSMIRSGRSVMLAQ
jgi:hypothetical protein